MIINDMIIYLYLCHGIAELATRNIERKKDVRQRMKEKKETTKRERERKKHTTFNLLRILSN